MVGNGWEEHGGGSAEIDGVLAALGKEESVTGARWRLRALHEGDELRDCSVDMVAVATRVSRATLADRMDCPDYGIHTTSRNQLPTTAYALIW